MKPLAEGGIDLFLPETYDIVWSLVILVIIAAVFYKVVLPKFQAVFDERAARIEGGIAKAEQAQKEAVEAKRKYEEQPEPRPRRSVQDPRRRPCRGLPYHRRRPVPARRRMPSRSPPTRNAPSNRKQQAAMVSLKGEVGTLATALAGKILGAKLQDDATQTAMLDQMIADLDSDEQ